MKVMDTMKKMADYEIAVERRLEKSCERDGWIASAHVAFGGDYVDCQLEKFGREEARNGALALHTHSSFDPTNAILTEVSESATSGTTTTKSKYGVVIETTTSAGTTTNFFDPYGRVFYTEKDGRSVDWIGRNDCGDVEEYDTFHSEGNAYYAEFYGYDSLGNRIAATNALGAVTYSAYDAENRLAESGGATYPVRNGYDTDGRRTSLTTFRTTGAVALVATDGDTTTWTFDPATGFCTVKTYADGSTIAYTHTSDGLLLRETKPSGAWKENVYDAARQIVGVVSSDGAQDASMQRDEFGRVMAESNSVALAEYSLDDCWGATNETQTVDGVSVSFERGFDAYGRIERFTRIGGEESIFDYAPHGAISTVSNGNVAVVYAFTGDALDAGYALAVQGGLDFSREVFRHGYLRSCIVAVSNHCGNVSQGLEYSYDALQRPVSRNSDSLGYNVRGEVVSATIDGRNESHSYDDIGNAVQAAYPVNTYDYTSNCRNQYSSIAAIAGGTQLVASVSYDIDGNMTRHGEWTYAYDSGNRLVSVASNGITVATMSYDTQGRRVKKVAADGIHRYFYDGRLLVYEHITRSDNTISEVEYVWGKDVSGTRSGAAGIGGLLYQKSDGGIYVPWYDAYGNILGYRDAQGNVVTSYTYDAFGNIIGQSGTMADSFVFRFSTKYFDADCDLYYYGYRHYKPQIMCWLTEDPIGEEGGINLYCFCRNQSSYRVDWLGRFAVYVHTDDMIGHVGLRTANSTAYDYGRYHGTYSGLGGTFPGPNVLKTNHWERISSTHSYKVFDFKVCKVLEDGITKAASVRFDNGLSKWPQQERFNSFDELKENERYMGTDWTLNSDNCMTFTFRTIVSGVKEAQKTGRLSRKAQRQARTLLWLSFDSCWQIRPASIGDLLERYARGFDWISVSE